MRLVKASSIVLLVVLVLALGLSATASAAPQKFKVLVGAENAKRGIDVMAFFPSNVRVHVGDTLHWVQNSNEIHTVTFLAGTPAPDLVVPAVSLGLPATPSPLVFNPAAVDPAVPAGGLGDTTTFVNSGLMGREPGQARSFDLTFAAVGTYRYLCLVHGVMMSGTVKVVGDDVRIATPLRVRAIGALQAALKLAKAPAVLAAARRQIKPPTLNPDGSRTHYVAMGFHKGQIDLMRFIPQRLAVKPGDTVVWEMRPTNDAPHTVTFLNGQPEPELVIPVPQPSGPPVLYFDPGTLDPAQPAAELTRSGLYNSGLMNPVPGTTYSQVVGDVEPGPLPYLCLLHDESGMKARLVVLAE